MKELCFFDPSRKVIRQRCHRQNHGRELSIKSSGKLGYHGKLVLKLGFGHEVFKLVDVFLESVIRCSVFVFPWFLNKFGQVSSSFELGVKRVEILVVVLGELCKCLFLGLDASVCHLIIPFLGEGYTFPNVHLTEDKGNLQFVQVVDFGVDREVCIYSFEPSGRFRRFC